MAVLTILIEINSKGEDRPLTLQLDRVKALCEQIEHAEKEGDFKFHSGRELGRNEWLQHTITLLYFTNVYNSMGQEVMCSVEKEAI